MALSVRNLHPSVLSLSEKKTVLFARRSVTYNQTSYPTVVVVLLLFLLLLLLLHTNRKIIIYMRRDIIRLHVWRGRAGPGTIKFASFENRHWHNECFVCSKCHVSLVGQGFLLDGADIVCSGCAPA